jgi:ADP-L-glycero-D-manno-heptose 6-epimerase
MHVVTGGAGFIGSNVVAALAENGREVAVCDWLRSDERWRNLAKHEIADIVLPEELLGWLDRNSDRIDAVIHMGANSSTTETDVDLIVRQNVRATLDLLEWCTNAGKRFIYASSAATYGDGSSGFDDVSTREGLSKFLPLNAYGWSKHVVDRRLASLRERKAALPPQCVGLKFFNVYGPNEYHKGSMMSVVARNFDAIRSGEPLRLFRSYRQEYGDGGQLRDFVYVKDCAAVIQWLLHNSQVSGLFNVGSGAARSWLDLAKAMFRAANLEPRIEFIDMPSALIEKYQYFTEAKLQRLRAAGYTNEFTALDAGVADYVNGYLGRMDRYR